MQSQKHKENRKMNGNCLSFLLFCSAKGCRRENPTTINMQNSAKAWEGPSESQGPVGRGVKWMLKVLIVLAFQKIKQRMTMAMTTKFLQNTHLIGTKVFSRKRPGHNFFFSLFFLKNYRSLGECSNIFPLLSVGLTLNLVPGVCALEFGHPREFKLLHGQPCWPRVSFLWSDVGLLGEQDQLTRTKTASCYG